MNDALGTRMKEQYEFRARSFLPRRTYTIIRLDGKAFHTWTRGLAKPYDYDLLETFGEVTAKLCAEIEGARFAYTQSDEISMLLTDFENTRTNAWFDGNLQKIVSVSASLVTAWFNDSYCPRPGQPALFDARAFTIPDPVEVANYFIWRQQDATRNSISSVAQAYFPHRMLQRKSSKEMQEMLWQEKGINWNDYREEFKRGTLVTRVSVPGPVVYRDKRTGEEVKIEGVERKEWHPMSPPIFTQSDWLKENIPVYSNE